MGRGKPLKNAPILGESVNFEPLLRGVSANALRAAERSAPTGHPPSALAHPRRLGTGDARFGEASVQAAAEALGLKFIFVARSTQKVQTLCRHDDLRWQALPRSPGWRCRKGQPSPRAAG